MGDSHQKLLDDCTVHPNFLYSSLYLHALIVRARCAHVASRRSLRSLLYTLNSYYILSQREETYIEIVYNRSEQMHTITVTSLYDYMY